LHLELACRQIAMLLSYQKCGISEKKEVKKSFENFIGGAPVFVSHQKKKRA